jgi:hypothetical protein
LVHTCDFFSAHCGAEFITTSGSPMRPQILRFFAQQISICSP